ncbi:hypothetical protein NUU61_000535 [Penicillium alfredii]|uniref:Vacuolar protein sorting-associated protein 62 n=1 Tax=Penicillium alfredii TaxID=1506179 RepID=A0A9W9G9U5_9EURO|nr:uncharacterized protein NUU61_000535 [Penicillium alfredii]KAJ5114776.1 hypothetical protein NUU61_000535 [Penicillium alfredii]
MSCLISRLALLAPVALSLIQPAGALPKARDAPTIPQYVIDYAPLVWLHSQDPYRPSDLQQQLDHTTAQVKWKEVDGAPSPLTLDNLDKLNDIGNTSVYLTSHEGIDISPEPDWFHGITPTAQGVTEKGTGSAIIVVDHGKGDVDAFYFYFYAYNKGNTVLGMEFGDHMGDWEHNMIRFSSGSPQAIWYSQHASGQAFTYDAAEKKGKRPYAYSGNGTHANYAIAGKHDHTIPGVNLPDGPLVDYSDRGLLWDPTANAYTYTYDPATAKFAAGKPDTPVGWLNFNGQWGDDQPPNEPSIFGQAKYVAGPNGPKFKHLDRKEVCPSSPCVVLPFRIWAEKNSTA